MPDENHGGSGGLESSAGVPRAGGRRPMTTWYCIQIERGGIWFTFAERFPTEEAAATWRDSKGYAWSKTWDCYFPLIRFKTRIIPESEKHS